MNKAERTEWAQAELNAEGEIVELRARIRELEAELSLLSQKPRENVVFWFTREHPHGMLTFEPNCTLCDLLARAEKAEVRVAELTEHHESCSIVRRARERKEG